MTTFPITVLVLNDIIASALLSNQLITLRYLMKYGSKLGCHITYFLNHFFVTNSLLLLNPTGIERCLRVCIHNLRYHLTKQMAMFVLCVLGVYSIGVSLRHVWVTGVLKFEVEVATHQTCTGYVCSFLRDQHILPIVEVFNLVDMINFATEDNRYIVTNTNTNANTKYRQLTKIHSTTYTIYTTTTDHSKDTTNNDANTNVNGNTNNDINVNVKC